MAFNSRGIKRGDQLPPLDDPDIRSNSATSIYYYRTADTAAVVEAANYFPTTFTLLKTGDVIQAVMNDGMGTTPVYKSYVVTSGVGSGQASNVVALQQTTAG